MTFQFQSDWLNFFLSVFWFTLLFMWIWLWISIVADIFRSHDLSGWGKTGWLILTVFLPFLGVFIYLIARGSKVAEHTRRSAEAMQKAQADYIREVAGSSTPSPATEIERLAALRDQGLISPEEFEQGKIKVLG